MEKLQVVHPHPLAAAAVRGERHPRSVTEQVSENQTHHRGIQSEDGEGKDRVQDAQQDPHADGLRAATFLQGTVL